MKISIVFSESLRSFQSDGVEHFCRITYSGLKILHDFAIFPFWNPCFVTDFCFFFSGPACSTPLHAALSGLSCVLGCSLTYWSIKFSYPPPKKNPLVLELCFPYCYSFLRSRSHEYEWDSIRNGMWPLLLEMQCLINRQ